MRFTGSSRWKSLRENSKPTTPKKRLKLPNKKFRRKPEEGALPLRRSLRLKYKGELSGEASKPTAIKWIFLTPNELAEFALCDYNEKHGTDLEFVRLLHVRHIFGPGYANDFTDRHRKWKHLNFEARRLNADPGDEPLLLFAEVYMDHNKYILSTLTLVKPTDHAYGCQHCWSYICHPRYGFRAGFDPLVASEPKILSKHVAAELSEFAIHDYNEKHGTNLKFERALECISFTCTGLLMDFNEKNTSWVHMNFEARAGPKEEILCLFAELYLGDDIKYVLATLSAAEPSDVRGGGKWKKNFLARECVCGPDEIRHPWRGFRHGFNDPPIQTAPDLYAKAKGIKCSGILQC